MKICAVLLTALVLTSCRAVHFYAQGAAGQWEIMRKARPIPEVMNECFGESTKVKERLALVQELREFAVRELELPAERQYDRYTDLHRKFVVWVVHAAPEFSVEAKTWWYPILGRLKYRGYFSEADAQREGERLRAQGMDVDVSGTEAYSTLGWLRDPVLNTFLNRSDGELAELIFHELTHQRLYLSGDTDFNEALATAVGEAGARLWLKSKGRLADLELYNRRHRLQHDIIAALLRTREELDRLYTQHRNTPPDKLRALKAAVFARLRAGARRLRIAAGVKVPHRVPLLNNAGLNSVAAYYELLPGFERLIKADHGSIPAFLRRAEAMKPLTKEQRRALLGPRTELDFPKSRPRHTPPYSTLEPKRSGDRLPQAARRANEVSQSRAAPTAAARVAFTIAACRPASPSWKNPPPFNKSAMPAGRSPGKR